LSKALPVAVVVIIILEVDGIKNVYLNFNLFLEVKNNFLLYGDSLVGLKALNLKDELI